MTYARPGDVLRGTDGQEVEVVNVFTAVRIDLNQNMRAVERPTSRVPRIPSGSTPTGPRRVYPRPELAGAANTRDPASTRGASTGAGEAPSGG